MQELYIPHESLDSITRSTGLKNNDLIRLDANENIFLPKKVMSQFLREIVDEIDVRTYPRCEEKQLVEALSEYLNLPTNYIVIGNGSDQLIESIVKVFVKDTEKTISILPTFVMYKKITRNQGCGYVEVPLNKDFSLNVNVLLSKVDKNSILCFLCSPNNPTGNQFDRREIIRVLEGFDGFVVVDEAYVDFASYSVVDLINEFDNLIILRTFSKAFGLAGLRIGYSLANPTLSKPLKGMQLPFNVNKISILLAKKVIEQRDIFEAIVQKVKNERTQLFNKISQISGVATFNSDANFLFFKTEEDSNKVYYGLQKRGVLIRRFQNILGEDDFFRVTVGSHEMNRRFIESLTALCEV